MKKFVLSTLIFLFIIACKAKVEDAKETSFGENSRQAKQSTSSDAPLSEEVKLDDELTAEKDVTEEKNEITPTTNPITNLSKERLLEYRVTLNYNCKDFYQSRKKLLEIIKNSAIIKESNATANIHDPNLNTTLLVKTENLYEVLLELDKIGSLVSESIYAEDLTEQNVLNKIQKERESKRIERRSIAVTQVSPAYQNWKDREDALERSENQLDEAKLQEWKITDRVTWAKVTIGLSGPELPTSIKVPSYRNAVVGSLNALLFLSYIALWTLPFLLIIGLIIYLIRRFGWRPNKL